MVVDLVREFHNHANLTALGRVDLIKRVFQAMSCTPMDDEHDTISRAELMAGFPPWLLLQMQSPFCLKLGPPPLRAATPRLSAPCPAQVVLKMLGQQAEPQHITYLLQSASENKPSSTLSKKLLVQSINKMDISLSVPLDLLRRLRKAWDECDADGDNALTPPQLKQLSNAIGLARTRLEA